MPYRHALGGFAKRSWEDFGDEVHRAQNEHLMEGIVAGCALIAFADGWVTTEEHDRMLGLIRGFEPIAAFGLGSGLIDQSQKITVAARAIAEKKTVGHRS